jgi:hypothetical protein
MLVSLLNRRQGESHTTDQQSKSGRGRLARKSRNSSRTRSLQGIEFLEERSLMSAGPGLAEQAAAVRMYTGMNLSTPALSSQPVPAATLTAESCPSFSCSAVTLDNDVPCPAPAQSNAAAKPNLTPYRPANWSDKIVVSTTTGTNTDAGSLTANDNLYVDWALINNGTMATSGSFTSSLYVDGSLKKSWTIPVPVNPTNSAYSQDCSLGRLSAGQHAIQIRLDVNNNVSESNERDNSYTKTINVVPAMGTSKNYAVLFSGGADKYYNYPFYYSNIKSMYETLIGSCALDPRNVRILFSDGTDPTPDRNPTNDTHYSGTFVNSDWSFAVSKGTPVLSASPANLSSTLGSLSSTVDGDDYFLFYSFDHGSGTAGQPRTKGEESLIGWADSSINDEQLAPWLSQVHAGHASYVFTQCFAGGMLDNLMPLAANAFGCAATNHYEYSYGDGFASAFVNGLKSGTRNTVDLFSYAYANDPYADHSSYAPNQGTFTQKKEHPWSTGANFPIFGGTATSSLANATSSSSGAVGMSGNATAANNFESVHRTAHSSRIAAAADYFSRFGRPDTGSGVQQPGESSNADNLKRLLHGLALASDGVA